MLQHKLSDEEQIRQLVQTWHAATQAGDLTTILSLMSDDVQFLLPGRSPMGKQEFATLSTLPEGGLRPQFQIDSVIQDIHVCGDFAYMQAHLRVRVTPPNSANTMVREGSILSIFRRSENEWLLLRDANMLATVPAGKPSLSDL